MTRSFRKTLCKSLDLPVTATNKAILARLHDIDVAFAKTRVERGAAQDRLIGDDLMEEAWKLTNGSRHKSYGRAEDVFRAYGLIWTGLLSHKLKTAAVISAEDVALLMVGLKIARDSQNGARDNVVDAHGYLSLLARMRGWIKSPPVHLDEMAQGKTDLIRFAMTDAGWLASGFVTSKDKK